MKRASRIALSSVEILAVVGIFAMMLHVSLNAAMRTFFSAPLFGTLELTSYWYLPFVASLGFVAAQLKNEHIRADLVFEALPHRAQVITNVVLACACSVVSALFFYYGFQEALHSLSIGQTAGNTDYQMWPFQMLTAAALGFLAVHYAVTAFVTARTGRVEHSADDEDNPTMEASS